MHGAEPIEAGEIMREQWETDPMRDPISQVLDECLDRATFHRRTGSGNEVAHAYAEAAELLRVALEVIGSEELDFDEAAAISTLARGTITNISSKLRKAGEGGPSRGRIQLSALPLRPLLLPTCCSASSSSGSTPGPGKETEGFSAADVAAGFFR